MLNKMFGKPINYDKEIKDLFEITSGLSKNINRLLELMDLELEHQDFIRENVLTIAKVQAQHKTIMTFLLNHVQLDTDAQGDLMEMLKDVKKIEDDIKKESKKKK